MKMKKLMLMGLLGMGFIIPSVMHPISMVEYSSKKHIIQTFPYENWAGYAALFGVSSIACLIGHFINQRNVEQNNTIQINSDTNAQENTLNVSAQKIPNKSKYGYLKASLFCATIALWLGALSGKSKDKVITVFTPVKMWF